MLMVGVLIYVSGFLSILLNRSHILALLLCLEFMYLGVLYNILMFVSFKMFFTNMIMFMIFIVCEAGLGLSILVVSVYFYGNDKLSSMILVKC
uniref:NADH-ubiquinone oxidoreductase chain 4L n=1 Tax=Ornithodoros hermsi TaxID=303297 RepID=A0A3G2K031_9ACAR|nr:NADH dehydrogenase subunit 4L [Ornithodoros hermsi]AYN50646.1 NADH dehydrogenase subunit 4L [Ornithodoros hermsi]UYB78375.1 NADH dehydrogenase subunit 4L [Ornithodoros hermsi]